MKIPDGFWIKKVSCNYGLIWVLFYKDYFIVKSADYSILSVELGHWKLYEMESNGSFLGNYVVRSRKCVLNKDFFSHGGNFYYWVKMNENP